MSILPSDSATRKKYPLAKGVLDYFPDALAAVARVSYVGNQQHNPGQPLHWDRTKSTDHADCILRHLIQRGTVDTDGVPHSAKLAWRALALLQIELEQTKTFSHKNRTVVIEEPGHILLSSVNDPADFSTDEQTIQPTQNLTTPPITPMEHAFVIQGEADSLPKVTFPLYPTLKNESEPFYFFHDLPLRVQPYVRGKIYDHLKRCGYPVTAAVDGVLVVPSQYEKAAHRLSIGETRTISRRFSHISADALNTALRGVTLPADPTFCREAPIRQKGIVYLSGPMRGLPQFNFPAFGYQREEFLRKGYAVISPADIDRGAGFDPNSSDSTLCISDFVARDITALLIIAAYGGKMVMLDKWEDSTGAVAEFFVARWLGMPIVSTNDKTLNPNEVSWGRIMSHASQYLDILPHRNRQETGNEKVKQ